VGKQALATASDLRSTIRHEDYHVAQENAGHYGATGTVLRAQNEAAAFAGEIRASADSGLNSQQIAQLRSAMAGWQGAAQHGGNYYWFLNK
jgi:hypothetical protein